MDWISEHRDAISKMLRVFIIKCWENHRIYNFVLKSCFWSGEDGRTSDRLRQELSKWYLLVKIGLNTSESELPKASRGVHFLAATHFAGSQHVRKPQLWQMSTNFVSRSKFRHYTLRLEEMIKDAFVGQDDWQVHLHHTVGFRRATAVVSN